MPRAFLWLPLGLIVAMGALLAFRLGWIDAHLTETDAIEAYATRYMRETGAPAADCHARPGDAVWLLVVCGQGPEGRIYRVNRFGGLIGVERPGRLDGTDPTTGAPQT